MKAETKEKSLIAVAGTSIGALIVAALFFVMQQFGFVHEHIQTLGWKVIGWYCQAPEADRLEFRRGFTTEKGQVAIINCDNLVIESEAP